MSPTNSSKGRPGKARSENRHLAAVLAEIPEVTAQLSAGELKQLETAEQYLGSAEAFRKALIAESDREDDDKEH